MKRFKITDTQAEAILELKLRHLAKLEEMKIRGEQDQLAEERDQLQLILGSAQRMKTLIRNEIIADAEQFGDERRSIIIERQAAQAMDETDLISAEPITVVLSQKGWIRAAKGHEIDPSSLSYRSGDGYLSSAKGRSTQFAVFLDSTGRAYSIAGHTLPSARGLGEPLTGRVKAPDGASFAGVMMGGPEDLYLLATDAGYGFVAQLGDLIAQKKAGKTVLSIPKGAQVLTPVPVASVETDLVAAITNQGKMLVVPVSEIPIMAKGKGNKIVGIPSAKVASREEFVCAIMAIPEGAQLVIHAGKRHLSLKLADLEHYMGERGRRGSKLPRGLQRVDSVSIDNGS